MSEGDVQLPPRFGCYEAAVSNDRRLGLGRPDAEDDAPAIDHIGSRRVGDIDRLLSTIRERDEQIKSLATALLTEWAACSFAGAHGLSDACGVDSDDCTFTCELHALAVRSVR